jgi:hypothetical protein
MPADKPAMILAHKRAAITVVAADPKASAAMLACGLGLVADAAGAAWHAPCRTRPGSMAITPMPDAEQDTAAATAWPSCPASRPVPGRGASPPDGKGARLRGHRPG